MLTSTLADPHAGVERTLSKLGLGCSQLGSLANPSTPAQTRDLLRRAFDLGVTVFDTADIYGQGDSEREIGRALGDVRDRVFVVTKFGKRFSASMRLLRPLKPLLKPLLSARGAGGAVRARREGVMRENFSPVWLRRALDQSLRRMKFDYVDGVLLHSPPPEVLDDPQVAALLAELKAQGKAAHFGVSCDHIEDLHAALAIPGLTILQAPLDVIIQAAAIGLDATIAQRRIAVFAREVIRTQPDRAPAEAVASCVRRADVTSVLAGVSRLSHLRELVRAVT